MGANRTVLLFEDDLDHVSIISYLLETADFVIVLGDPMAYRENIVRYRPGVILLDQWLSGSLGSTICAELKADPTTRSIPVILTSASNRLNQIALDCKPDDTLPKPFDVDELVGKVTRLMKIAVRRQSKQRLALP